MEAPLSWQLESGGGERGTGLHLQILPDQGWGAAPVSNSTSHPQLGGLPPRGWVFREEELVTTQIHFPFLASVSLSVNWV